MQRLGDFAAEHGMGAGPLRNLMKSVLLLPQGGKHTRYPEYILMCSRLDGAG